MLTHEANPQSNRAGSADLASQQALSWLFMQVVCISMAVAVTVLSIQTLLSPEAATLQSDFFAVTPTTTVLVKLAVAFFCWDLYVCLTEWAGWAYLGHALACLCVFTCALRPMLHYMAAVTLLYEASTPFLHLRLGMIQSDAATGPLFHVVQLAFALSFVLARIVIGYWKCWTWWWQVETFLSSASAAGVTPAVLRMYQAACLFLSALNGWWAVQIAQKAVGGAPAKDKLKKSA